MRLFHVVCLVLCGVTLVACTKTSSDGTDVAARPDTAATASGVDVAGENSGVATDTSAADSQAVEPAIDYGDWLPPPEDLDRRYREPYPKLVQAAQAGDAEAHMNLALLSQQIALSLARADNIDAAYEFILQSGRALRAGMPEGASALPEAKIQDIFLMEASALARSGQLPAAASAIDDAVANGFSQLSAIEQDPELAAVTSTEGYAERLEGWQKTIQERAIVAARTDLAAGETYPFEFAGTDIEGNAQSLESLAGKVVIVDFWGTWCPPCRAEIPSFVKLQETYGDQGFQMIGLNYERKESEEENVKAVKDFAEEFSINYPCILSDEETRAQVPGFRGFPTTLFIDRSGKVRMTVVGLHDYAYLEAVVNVLLAEKPAS